MKIRHLIIIGTAISIAVSAKLHCTNDNAKKTAIKMYKQKSIFQICGMILLICFSSCKQNYSTKIGSPIAYWDCTKISEDNTNLTSILHITKITGLEEKSGSMIGSINKLIYEDSLYFIMDNDLAKKVFIFDSSGKFISNIGKSGSGPNEFLQLNDMSYSPTDSIIYILCDYTKILGYDLNGNLRKKTVTPYRMINMEVFDNNFYFVSEDPTAHEAIICDNNLNILSAYFPNNSKKTGHRLVHALHKTPGECITFYRYLDNNIYDLSSSKGDSITLKYSIDFGDTALERTMLENMDKKAIKTEKGNKRGHIKYFSETNDYASIVFFDKDIPCISFFNRKTGEAQSYYIQNVSEDIVGTIYSPLEYSDAKTFLQVIDDPSYSEYRYNTDIVTGENPLIISLGK